MMPAKAVLSLSPDMSLRQALRIMLARGVHAAPVIDAQASRALSVLGASVSHQGLTCQSQGGVLGVLSQTDLLPLAAGGTALAASRRRAPAALRRGRGSSTR